MILSALIDVDLLSDDSCVPSSIDASSEERGDCAVGEAIKR